MKVQGGCHCRAVRFEAEIPGHVELLQCNCSICTPSGYLHCIVPHEDFLLLSAKDVLTSYRFGTGQAEHLFCKICGIKSFYQPRSHPDCWSIQFACLDPDHGIASRIVTFDGQNWENASKNLG
ncbi:MAG TPA: GFA family protein [Erythrobacter sp.]|nr:GFA family protein [Erythrobacter sp.]